MTLPSLALKYLEMPDATATELHETAMKSLRSDYNRLVYKTVLSIQDEPTNTATIGQSIRMTRAGARLDDDTIQTLVFLVIMEAAKDVRNDLKEIMADEKKLQDAKKELRERIQQQQKISAGIIGSKYKCLSDIGVEPNSEMTLLKMQMALERLVLMYATIGNMMKTNAETFRTIIANMR